MNNLLSIALGLTAWILPIVYLMARRRRELFLFGSLAACAASLFFQLREVMHRTTISDLSAIMDTIHAVNFCAAVLLIVTLTLNAIALLRRER